MVFNTIFLTGLQNSAICGIISERKQAQIGSCHTMWVSIFFFCFFLCFPDWNLMFLLLIALLYYLWDGYLCNAIICVLFFAVTGMEASVGMFTSSLGHRDTYHHMIQPISILTVMQMLTRFGILTFNFSSLEFAWLPNAFINIAKR